MKNNNLSDENTQLSKDDQDWLALLAGQSVEDADPKTVSEAAHLRALLTPLSFDEPIEADESGLNAIKSRLESEGYIVSRKRESRFHWLSEWLMSFQFEWRKIVAVPVTLAIGFLLIRMFPDNSNQATPQNEGETSSAVSLAEEKPLRSKGMELEELKSKSFTPFSSENVIKQQIQIDTKELKTSAESIEYKLKKFGINAVREADNHTMIQMSIDLAHLSPEQLRELENMAQTWTKEPISPLGDLKNLEVPKLYIIITQTTK